MKSDTKMKVRTLDDDESWQLFVKNAGDVANLEHIQPLAKEIARECGGLPLAITVIGTSMRGKTRVELWRDALKSLRMSEPHNKDVEEKVYMVIKWSIDSLESLEKRSNMNKRRGDIRSCFLYCSLYPAAISTDDLIHSWWAEGFLGEHDTYEEPYNRGITMFERLKDACLLEVTHDKIDFLRPQQVDYVKMHDVVRNVAKWIDNSFGLTEISQIDVSASVKRISFVSKRIQSLPDNFTECPETTSLLLQDNKALVKIPHGFFLAFPALRVLNLSYTGIRALPSSINSLCQLRALILQNCSSLTQLPPIGDLCDLQLLDCDNTRLCCLPPGVDKLINLRLLNLPVDYFEESIGQGFFLKLPKIEMLNMASRVMVVGPTSFDEISSLPNLTSLCIRLDSSSIFNGDYTWMSRLKSFHIEIGEALRKAIFNKSTKRISVSHCETFSNGELSGMLQFASHLHLNQCMGLRKLIAYNSFDGLKALHIENCSCDFRPSKEGSGQFDPLPNLEILSLYRVHNLKSVSDLGHLLGLRFSKLYRLFCLNCSSLTYLFNVGGAFSVPKCLEEINVGHCPQLAELFVQCSSSKTTLVNSEVPRARFVNLLNLPELRTFREPESMWEHLEELEVKRCDRLRKLPLSIQTSKTIKVIRGSSKWWSQLEWDDDNFKSNLEHCFTKYNWTTLFSEIAV